MESLAQSVQEWQHIVHNQMSSWFQMDRFFEATSLSLIVLLHPEKPTRQHHLFYFIFFIRALYIFLKSLCYVIKWYMHII